MVKKDRLLELGGFRPDLGTLADLDFALRLCTLQDVSVVREPLVRYRTHPAQMHRNWNTTLLDLNKLDPTSYSSLQNLDKDDWIAAAKRSHDWNVREKIEWRGHRDSLHRQMLVSGISLRCAYLIGRLRVELDFS